jgi:hypothetical protein
MLQACKQELTEIISEVECAFSKKKKNLHNNVDRMEVNSLESTGANMAKHVVKSQAVFELCDK